MITAATLANLNCRAPKNRVHAITMSHVMECLFTGPATYEDMIEASGLSRTTVAKIVASLRARRITFRDQTGPMLRVCRWEVDSLGRHTIAVYEWNYWARANVSKPKAGSRKARQKRYRDNLRYLKGLDHALARNQGGDHHGQAEPHQV